ncbi:hypothetical protein MASR2M79_13510 [Aminivibrio sp.]
MGNGDIDPHMIIGLTAYRMGSLAVAACNPALHEEGPQVPQAGYALGYGGLEGLG